MCWQFFNLGQTINVGLIQKPRADGVMPKFVISDFVDCRKVNAMSMLMGPLGPSQRTNLFVLIFRVGKRISAIE
jgi:hypothetical protein